MTKPIRVGVIGVGSLGRHHARLYGACERAELVGVFDADAQTADRVAHDTGVPAYDHLDRLLEEVEACSIAVPTDLHFELGKHIMGRKKHVLMEKPITETVEEAGTLIRLAAENNLVLQVGHVERFNPVIDYLERKATNPMFIETHRLAPYPPPRPGMKPRGTEVGVVLDLMIHDIDMVLNLVHSPISQIDAVGVPVLSMTEDIANARLRFENGCVVNLTASRVTPEPMRKIRVFQSNTYISLDYQNHKGELFTRDGEGILREEVPIHSHNALQKELEHFLDCIALQKKSGEAGASRVPGEHGMRALQIAVDIRKQFGFLQ